jgi:hypothetical protein
VVAARILYLKRDRAVAGGVFVAVALTLAITIPRQVLETAPLFGRWQTVLFLVLEIIEGVLLALAAVRAIGTRKGDLLRPAVRVLRSGGTLALVTECVDPSQQRKSLKAGAVSELQGIARFKTPSAHLLSITDLASRGSIALR